MDVMLTNSASQPRLSKSKFLAGLQCHKRLYLEVHQPSLAAKPDAATQAILDMGNEVGEWARRRFPGGVLVHHGHRQAAAAIEQTSALMRIRDVPAIFEAALQHGPVLVRADILERVSDDANGAVRWRLIEVKASSRVKSVHLDDLAIQSHVAAGAGLALSSTCLMHINTRYRYEHGEVDPSRLFTIQDVSDAVGARRRMVPDRLAAMQAMLQAGEPPAVEPGDQCMSPYECPFWSHCTKDKPTRWIYCLPGGKRALSEFKEQGLQTIDEIPDGTALTIIQRRVKDGVEWVSPELQATLDSVTYPVHHLDFETVMPPVPRYSMTRPYQAIPVQWSDHIEYESGVVLHREFLHQNCTDPRKELTIGLLDALGDRGSICVYSDYERVILEQLAEALPEFRRDLEQVIARLWDLLPVIRNHYYHPGFAGSYSIKSVLPAVIPSMAYEDLPIRDGGQAASQYYRMVFVETDWVARATTSEALLRYCAHDTVAMLELRRALRQKASRLARGTASAAHSPETSGEP